MQKIIHCIWLGNRKSRLVKQCQGSWKRFAPDWEIRESGMAALKGYGELPPYVRHAVETGKWAFVSDWLRFVLLKHTGGIYFDCDVELVAPLTRALEAENLLESEWCAGEWLMHGGIGFAPGAGIALQAGSPIAQMMLAQYTQEHFDGRTTVGDIMGRLGVPIQLLDPEVMCPYDWQHRLNRTDRTFAIHHYALSWISW
ncbi:MAG: glycosyltransferase family 32 protein, partial [Kiritimatiellia bacterium]